MTIIPAASHRIMPWKNGGGRTDEIAIHPPGAGMEGFSWRLSMAHVGGDGPFSVFAGIDRTLSVLSGGTMHLAFSDGETVRLAPGDAPVTFSGDRPVHATVTAPLVDLNIMTRRGRMTHLVERPGQNDKPLKRAISGLALVFAEGEAKIEVDGNPVRLARHDTLALDGQHQLTLSGPVIIMHLNPV